jgi:hypothetical protein
MLLFERSTLQRLFKTYFKVPTVYDYHIYYIKHQQDRQCTYNVTLRRVHETAGAVEKQQELGLHTSTYLCVCVCVCVWVGGCTDTCVCFRACSLTNTACNASQYCILRPFWLHYIFQNFFIDRTIFEKR